MTARDDQGPILIATDIPSDAGMIRKLLGAEFAEIAVSTIADAAARDFERVKPRVLLLAFNTLEKAERYYLGLYRFCQVVHSIPHRTLILCDKEELRSVYDLCRREFFDDYVVFWPLSHDGHRLLMSVHLALRALKSQAASPSLSEFASQARRMAGFEELLNSSLETGGRHMADAGESLERAQAKIYTLFEQLSQELLSGSLSSAVKVVDPAALQRELQRLLMEELRPPLQAALESTAPVRKWATDLGSSVKPHLDSVRRMHTLVEQLPVVVLVVDDDELQVKALEATLKGQKYELITARSGTAALNEVRKRRPDVIFLDVELPDLNGVEVLRRLQALPATASIPVVMLSGYSSRQVVVDSQAAGARGFIVKPFDAAVLNRKLKEVLQLLPGGAADS